MAENNPVCITHHYDVLRLIFRFLCAQDLDACSKVCKEWKEVVNNTFKRRRLIQAFAIKRETKTPFILNRALLTLVVDTGRNYDYGQKLYISDELIYITENYGSVFYYNGSDELSSDRHDWRYSSVLRFPPHDEVIIKTIHFDTGIKLTEDEWPEKFGIPVDTPIKAIMMIGVYESVTNADQKNAGVVIDSIKSRNSCAFAGTVITRGPSVASSLSFSITVFAGENIEAGSCVLDAEPSENNIEIQNFSERVTKLDNSVVIIFNSLIEYIPTIRKCFPTSSIFSCDGFAQVGHDYPTDKYFRVSSVKKEGFVLLYIGYKN